MKKLLIISATLVFCTACITYTGFAKEKVDNPPQKKGSNATLNYYVADYSSFKIFGGPGALAKAMKRKSPCSNVEGYDSEPTSGEYVRVTIKKVDPSIAALLFGYIGVSTATILPFWSMEDGYNITFEIRRDGARIKSYDYEIRRSGFIWIGMLPFSWVNFFTYSEVEAFEATVFQFFDDAAALLPK